MIENFSLSELKNFLGEQSISQNYVCLPIPSYLSIYTTVEGMDMQNSYEKYEVCAKFWIQYFPLSSQFALNVNFFANIDGAPIGSQDFIRLIPTAVKQYEYYNSEKIRWVYETDMYVKVIPTGCPLGAYPNILTITPIG
jgi:hypothetical protein